MALPVSYTYRNYVHFIRNQGPGGCFTYATLYIMEILFQKEYNLAYAPNLSFAFADYLYNSKYLYNPKTKKYDKWNLYRKNHFKVLKHLGCCTEATMPTNYDRGVLEPTPEQILEASNFKVKAWGHKHRPTQTQVDNNFVNRIKKYIYEIGPVWACVWLNQPGPNNESHVVAIIGYDDNRREFEYVNSIGDRVNGGFGTIPYNNNFKDSNLFPQIYEIQWVKTKPIQEKYIPTAIINISTQSDNNFVGRNTLVVRLGAEGVVDSNGDAIEQVIWDRNNSYQGAAIGTAVRQEKTRNSMKVLDDSYSLILKVPLPKFPPLYHHVQRNWYIEVENHSLPEYNNFFPHAKVTINGFMLSDSNGKQHNCSRPLPLDVPPMGSEIVKINLLP